jgi:purine-binding chemotaxis protein CheW
MGDQTTAGVPPTDAPTTPSRAPGAPGGRAEAPPTASSPEDAVGTEGNDFVTFALGDEAFAFPMARVREIIRLPETVAVPLSPHSLVGLANLRGQVLPVVSLRDLCGYSAVDAGESTRVIVVDCGVPLGFVVDRVAAVVSVDPGEVEDASSIRTAIDSRLLAGVIRHGEGDRLLTILEVEHLVDEEFAGLARGLQADPGAVAADAGDAPDEDADDTYELVSFVVDGQEYALPIDAIQEIVQAPPSVTEVPNADARVVGLMDLRGRLLPVISLRSVFGLRQDGLQEANRIVVVPLEADGRDERLIVGVLMDTVREVLRVPASLVDTVPGFLARRGATTEVESVCRLDGGGRMVSVLSVERLFADSGLRSALERHGGDDRAGDGDGDAVDLDDDEKLVVFRIAAEEYSIGVDAVQEIIRVPEALIQIPEAPDAVEGLVNLRGSVLPVINLRTRLGMPCAERDDLQRIVVLVVGDTRTGFIVDAVLEVLKLERAAVEPAPDLSDEQSRLISHVANLPDRDRMLLMLDAEQLADIDGAALAAAA